MNTNTSRITGRAVAFGLVSSVLTAAVLVTPMSPASAHRQSGLTARILSNNVACDDITFPFCAVEGRVRVRNNKPAGTGRIAICVGIDVHTPGHRSLSVEPPMPAGQAITTLRPGNSRVVRYRTVFNADAGVAHHVHVTHVHKSIAHSGGKQC